MSSSQNPALINTSEICDEFTRINQIPTIDLFHLFLQKPNDYLAGSIIERRFMPDKIWIAEEERYDDKKIIPPLGDQAALFIKKLDEQYSKNPASLSARQVSLLGLAYELGMGVAKDEGKGHHLYLYAAEKNCGYAMISLVNAFSYGETAFALNKGLALKYLDKAVALGDCAALRFEGDSLEKQAQLAKPEKSKELYEKAFQRLDEAAKKQDATALYLLGCAYCNGSPIVKGEVNNAKGLEYLSQAAVRGKSYALIFLYEKTKDINLLMAADKFGDRHASAKLAKVLEDTKGYNSWVIDMQIIPALQKSDTIISSLVQLGPRYLSFRKNEEKAAVYFYRTVRKAPELASMHGELVEFVDPIFAKQLVLPVTQRNHKMNYQLAFSHRVARNEKAKKLMTEFAKSNPAEFLSISEKDSWDIVKDLVDVSCVRSLEDKILADIRKIYHSIQQAIPSLHFDLVRVIFSFDTKFVGHFNLFSKMPREQLAYVEEKSALSGMKP